jgi:hypothetical protein
MKIELIKAYVVKYAAENGVTFSDESHFENGYGSKYITAPVNTIGLKNADARLGNRLAIVRHLEGGCISVISGYLTPTKLMQWMMENKL